MSGDAPTDEATANFFAAFGGGSSYLALLFPAFRLWAGASPLDLRRIVDSSKSNHGPPAFLGRPPWPGLLLAFAATGVALLARFLLDPLLGNNLPYVTFFLGVAFVTWRGSLGASLLAVTLSAFAGNWFFMPPRHTFVFETAPQLVAFVTYFIVSLAFVAFGYSLQRTRRAAEGTARLAAAEEERLRVTLGSIGDAVIATDTQGRITYLNPVAAALTGWDATEARRQPVEAVFKIVNEQTRNAVENPVARVLREGAIVGLANHTVLLARDGRELPIADSAAPIRDPAGQIMGVVMVFRDQTAERAAQRALRESEERHRIIVELSPDGILTMDERSVILSVNPAAEKMFGYTAAELVGQSMTMLMPERLRARHRAGVERFLKTGERNIPWGGVELPGQRKDGREIPLEISFGSHLREGRRLFIGTMRDISERKRVSEITNRLAAVVEFSDDAVYTIDLDGVLTSWNRGAERHFGYTDQEAIGQPVAMLIPPHRLKEEEEILSRLKRGEAIEHYETERRRKDGAFLHVSLTVSPLRDERGRIVGASKIARDITARKQSEERLRSTEAWQRLLLESVLDFAIVATDARGIVTDWNPGAAQMFGYARDEIVGQDSSLLFTPEDRAVGVPQREMRAAETQGHAVDERWHVHKNGHRFFTSGALRPLRDGAGTLLGFLKVARDITERQRNADALREQQVRLEAALKAATTSARAKDFFIASLSHELRTPLTPVLLTLSGLHRDPALTPAQRKSLDVIERNVRLEAQMVNDLLDLSRFEHGKFELTLAPCNLHEIVRRALDTCTAGTEPKKLNTRLKLEAPRHEIHGDAARLQQVFWNLIQNAVKFTPSGGTITVSSQNAGNTISITVADTGIGIAPEMLQRIFEPFSQEKRESSGSLRGLGLGLAIARRIVAAHGGSLSAASEGVDRGAAFTVKLPTAPGP